MTDSLKQFIINKDSTLKDALIQMTSSHRGILLVTDTSLHLVGVIADGDVRRALLDDVSLNIPVTQIMNLNPVVADNREHAEKILDENPYYILVPVVNGEGKLTGVLSALNGNGNEYYKKEVTPEKDELEISRVEKNIKYMAVIPARGGSKRIPGKNLSKIGNETLLSLAIKSASESKYIDHIIVSTDSNEIAKEAEDNGIKVPWKRPEQLSGDSAKTVDVLLHSLKMFQQEYKYNPEFVILLEPTAPLRTSKLIDKAIETFKDEIEADSLVSVNKIRHIYHPEELLKTDNSKYLTPYMENRTFDSRKSREEQTPLYVQNGIIYITRFEVLDKEDSIYGGKVLKFETSEDYFADIDEVVDLEIARLKYEKLTKQNK